MPPVITLFCAFTRRWAVDRWIEDLRSAKGITPALTNLCFIVDCDEPYISNRLKDMAEADKYRSCRVIMNPENNPNETNIPKRRNRIAAVHGQSKALVARTDGRYILGLEDDTVFGGIDFTPMIDRLVVDLKVGLIEGVQVGRWTLPDEPKMVGAWHVTPNEIHSMRPEPDCGKPEFHKGECPRPHEGFQRISGGGFYGYVTRVEEYMAYSYTWDESKPYGPDVSYGLWLERLAYENYIHWPTVFGHNDHNILLYPDANIGEVRYTRVNNHWERHDISKAV